MLMKLKNGEIELKDMITRGTMKKFFLISKSEDGTSTPENALKAELFLANEVIVRLTLDGVNVEVTDEALDSLDWLDYRALQNYINGLIGIEDPKKHCKRGSVKQECGFCEGPHYFVDEAFALPLRKWPIQSKCSFLVKVHSGPFLLST